VLSEKTEKDFMVETIEILSDPHSISVDDVMEVFSHGAWTCSRPRNLVANMVLHSSILVIAKEMGRPVGVARVISDQVFRAFVEDVIVVEDKRGKGIGRLLIQEVERRLLDWDINRIELISQHPVFWNKLGFLTKHSSTYLVKFLRKES
jgi:GNAT superfamily N-acetyltransferase